MKGLLEILTSASEYSQIPIRPGEEETLRRLMNHQRFSFENPKLTDPNFKANVLLQAHFARHVVDGNLRLDQKEVLLSASRLLQAMVDVISSNGWLSLALLAMEVSQMVTQAMWERDSVLLQLPHFDRHLAKKCEAEGVETVFDVMEMEDERRRELLGLDEREMGDVARFCNRFPNVDVSYEVKRAGEEATVEVRLEREGEVKGAVDAGRYPKAKEEGWWLVVGDKERNQLVAIKRVALQKRAKVKLEFGVGEGGSGKREFVLYFMCDSYMGCDQEYVFTVEDDDDQDQMNE